MKNKISIFFTIIAVLLMTSCSTSTKTVLSGKPGTEIYQLDGEYVGTIPVSGELKTKIPDGTFQALMLSQKQGEKTRVPFALNYKNKGHAGTKFTRAVGYVVTSIGLIADLVATIMIIDDSENEDAVALAAIGGGATFLGASMIMPTDARLNQDAYKYNYQFLKKQTTNDDIIFTKPTIDYVADEPIISTAKLRPTRTSESDKKSQASGTQKVKRNMGVSTKKFQGEYVGTGTISLGDETMETLKGVTIKIQRIDSSTVGIDIVEVDGNNFFGTSTEYRAAKDGKDGIILTHNSISDAVITIDKEGNLEYYNPSLEIDGTVYTFSIKAERQ